MPQFTCTTRRAHAQTAHASASMAKRASTAAGPAGEAKHALACGRASPYTLCQRSLHGNAGLHRPPRAPTTRSHPLPDAPVLTASASPATTASLIHIAASHAVMVRHVMGTGTSSPVAGPARGGVRAEPVLRSTTNGWGRAEWRIPYERKTPGDWAASTGGGDGAWAVQDCRRGASPSAANHATGHAECISSCYRACAPLGPDAC